MIDPLASAIMMILVKALRAYFGLFERAIQDFNRISGLNLSISLDTFTARPIDERIAKIDIARANLQDALSALKELSSEAERNKEELNQALQRLNEAKAAHASESEQLAQIKNIAQSDIEAFRRMAGIVNPLRERILGFIAGVVASLVAAGIWQIGASFFVG